MGFKEKRKAMGITQDALAKQMQVSRSTISMWETAKAFPRSDKLPKLARILGCSIDDLLPLASPIEDKEVKTID